MGNIKNLSKDSNGLFFVFIEFFILNGFLDIL